MFENVFKEFKKLHGLEDDLKIILTPGCYPVQKICVPKNRIVTF